MNAIITLTDELDFVPADGSRANRSRLAQFEAWQLDNGHTILRPDVRGYALYLERERGLSKSSVNAYLSTVRGRYKKHILKSNAVRDLLVQAARAAGYDDPANSTSLVNEQLTRLENALDAVTVKQVKRTVKTDEQMGRWLNPREAAALLAAPDVTTLEGLRDRAIFTLMLFTGIRAAELCNVRLKDVYQKMKGKPGLDVTEGKGAKQRFVAYGVNVDRVLSAVEAWTNVAGITDGLLFRGFKKEAAAKLEREPSDLRDTKMNTRTLGYIFERYTVSGEAVRPHDTRRTYARALYDAGVPVPEIQHLLGHASYDTTLVYLGIKRHTPTPPALFVVPDEQTSLF